MSIMLASKKVENRNLLDVQNSPEHVWHNLSLQCCKGKGEKYKSVN